VIISFILSFLILSCKNVIPGKEYKLQGNIKGVTNTEIYLRKYQGSGYCTIDSVFSANGEFSFNGSVILPELFRISLNNSDEYIPIFVENTNISINANIGKLDSAIITGSSSNNLLVHFWYSIDSIDKIANPLFDSYNSAKKIGDSMKVIELENEIESNAKIQNQFIKDFVKNHSTSVVSAFVLYKYLSGELELEELASLNNNLDTNIKKSIYSDFLKKQIEILKKTQIGMPAIDFVLSDTSGIEFKLSSLYGKYILIDFWASWCSSCRQENPNVVSAFNKFKNKRFTILGVSFDTKRANWINAIKEDKIVWNQVSDLKGWENSAGKLYGIRAIPSNLLLDPKGIIIAKNLRGTELYKKLATLLK